MTADRADTPPTMTIDCDTCAMRRSRACRDCVVTFLIDRDERADALGAHRPEGAVVVAVDELRSLRRLAEAGLVPRLRHRAG